MTAIAIRPANSRDADAIWAAMALWFQGYIHQAWAKNVGVLMLTGSLRTAQEARERAEAMRLQDEIDAKQREVARLRAALDARTQYQAETARRRGADAPQHEKGKGNKAK